MPKQQLEHRLVADGAHDTPFAAGRVRRGPQGIAHRLFRGLDDGRDPRCPVAEERCKETDAALQALDGVAAGHRAACVLL